MLENLINLVKEQAGTAINENPAIPNEHNEEAAHIAGNSIFDSLKSSLANGNINDVLGMFSGKQEVDASHPVVQQASGNLTSQLQDKYGLDQQQASGISGSLIPNVLKQLVQKSSTPGSGFNIQDIFNQLSGGKTSGMDVSSLVNKFKSGLDKDGDGDVDLQDLKSLFSGGGSVMDKVKGLFN